jgi:YD repeat-containing protein
MADVVLAIFLLFVSPMIASAAEPQTTFRDAQGRTTGYAAPQGGGSTQYYDSSGKSLGTSTTTGGQTKYYDAQGRSIGTSTGPARAPFPERK